MTQRGASTWISHGVPNRSVTAPKPGDQPHLWVEVDEKAPAVRLIDAFAGTGPDLGKLTVHWSANDAFLKAQPVTLSYATSADGPWTPLATKLDNTGTFTVPPHEYFMMGDNRRNSDDSRADVGFVPEANLEGKAQMILFSWYPGASLWKPWTWVTKLRLSRFFKPLV